jgi:hypothetical protein
MYSNRSCRSLILLLLLTCRFSQAAFVGGRYFPAADTRTRTQALKYFRFHCHCYSQKISKVAEAANEWPDDLPSWVATVDWKADATSAVSLQGPPWSVTVANDAPLWEQIFAQVWPREDPSSSTVVQPACAFLAPVGGCDNLCDEKERYSDSCTFTVDSSNPDADSSNPDADSDSWLLIRTEERQWAHRLVSSGDSTLVDNDGSIARRGSSGPDRDMKHADSMRDTDTPWRDFANQSTLA